ncbi:hypothetical protein ELS24_10535 [Achromobacter spanius]|uniref:hypothetical protein n=1 Tax=Achromobacter spanius TaxID=217203 RepID=UPI000F8F8A8C|nr:hypothetical protein [Achromobacter spanius]AZS78844.1 hypothetical protein ELS24_10535 [Achromobacter spanius]
MRIPTGDFGNAVARPASAPQVGPGSFGGQEAAAQVQMGQAVQQVGNELAARQQDLNRIKSIRTMAEAKNSLYTLEDEITQGISKGDIDPAEAQKIWGERSPKLVSDRLASIGAEHRELINAQLTDTSNALAGRVRDAATKRTQQNIGGELTALGGELEREAVRDRAGANAKYEASVRGMGPQAGMTPAQIETAVLRFKESSANTVAYTALNAARNSGQALGEFEKRLTSDEFADLDPQRRAVLLNTTAGYKTALEQRALAQAQRAEIQAAKRDRQAAGVYTQAVTLATEGKKLDPNWIAGAAQQVAGTPYEAGFKAAVEQAPAGTAFAMQPLRDQREMLDGLLAEGNKIGWTPTRQDQYDKAQKSYETSQREYKEDPLRAAVDRNVLPELAPLDVSGGIAGITQGVQARLEQAKQVEVVAGRPVSPFTSDEAVQVATLFNGMPTDQRATTLANLSKTVGPRTMSAIAAQLDNKDRSLALAAALGDQQRPNGGLVSEQILRGEQAMKDKRVPDADVTRWRTEIAAEVRGVFATPEMEDAVIDAAVRVRADADVRRAGRSIRNAIDTVSGSIVDFNGGKIPLPLGMTESQFERGLVALTPDSFTDQAPDGNVFVAGKAVPVADFVKDLPNAVLRHAGQGIYTVSSGTGFVLNQAGQPVIVRINNGTR